MSGMFTSFYHLVGARAVFAQESCVGRGRGGWDHATTMLPLGLHESTNPGPGSNCTWDLIPHTHTVEGR